MLEYSSQRWFLFQSTLPLRGATLSPYILRLSSRISIHTPLAGSDAAFRMRLASSTVFQSTLPLRGATRPSGCVWLRPRYFNPHSPCGERPRSSSYACRPIHFNPHSPCGERLGIEYSVLVLDVISIHTPLAGSDFDHRFRCFRTCAISIHTPLAGSDLFPSFFGREVTKFQSTLPLRGATQCRMPASTGQQISIHTPLAGSDKAVMSNAQDAWKFQSTLPLRGATRMDELCRDTIKFQSTLPLRGATAEMRHF